MTIFAQNKPLTDAELDQLDKFLNNYKGGKAMNLEEVDGFFSALIAGPEIVMPSEYLPEVLGCDIAKTHSFETLEEANEILGLLMRHSNDIAGTLLRGKVYLPVLEEDENGVRRGNDWAHGFIQGTRMRHDRWAELLADDDHGGCMIPMLMLHHEHDEDPTMRPKPIGPEQREKVIESMAVGLVEAYLYFRPDGKPNGSRHKRKSPNTSTKIGRNIPCPCGSGKKYKKCCGNATIN